MTDSAENNQSTPTADPYRAIIDTLTGKKRVLVTTHVRPDGDALGSTVALILGLKKVGIDAELMTLSKLPSKYDFVVHDNGVVCHDKERGGADALDQLSRFDAFVVCDTGTWSQLPGVKERIAEWNVPKIVIDHHLTQEDWATVKLVVKEAAAAAEIIAELLDQWSIPIDTAIGTAIFLGIATDTGWMQYSNTRPYTFRLAARLVEAGVNTDRMYQLLYQNERAERIVLQAQAQRSLELLADGRLAVMQVSQADFQAAGADSPDTENLINIPLQIRTVQASILLNEPKEPGPIRVSLRSKGQVNVSKVAEQFGGGGHARASGLRVEGTLAEAKEKVVVAMVAAMG